VLLIISIILVIITLCTIFMNDLFIITIHFTPIESRLWVLIICMLFSVFGLFLMVIFTYRSPVFFRLSLSKVCVSVQ